MIHDRASWRMKMRHAALASTLAYLSLAYLDGSAVQAQSALRVPTINVPTRTPTITPNIAPTIAPTVTPRIDPSIAGRAVTRLGPTTPNLKTYQSRRYGHRHSDRRCHGQTIYTAR